MTSQSKQGHGCHGCCAGVGYARCYAGYMQELWLGAMPEQERQACKQKAEQVSSGHQHVCQNNHHMAGGGLLVGVVMHLLHQIIGDDHYLLP